MKHQRKRLAPERPHKPATLRWSRVVGWHRRVKACDRGWTRCTSQRPTGSRGRRIPLLELPF